MNKNSNSGGISFLGLLTIAFVVLKLTGAISWPWWVVLSPAGLWIAMTIIMLIIAFNMYK